MGRDAILIYSVTDLLYGERCKQIFSLAIILSLYLLLNSRRYTGER